MNTTNEQLNERENFPAMQFNEEIQYYLFETAKWAKMLSIFGFIVVGLIVLLAFSIGSIFTFLGRINPEMSRMAGAGAAGTVVYLVMAVIYFFPTLYLYQFAAKAKEGITYNTENQLTEAFSKLKSFFKFWGIFTLVIVVFYILIIIMMLVGGVGLMNSMS